LPLPTQIEWTALATAEALELHRYVAEGSLGAANRQLTLILESIQGLTLFPGKGRIGRVRGTRELVVAGTPYIVAYRLEGTAIQILSILHGARRWPDTFPTS
jgi:toxin ParE1/3/4